MEQFIPVKYRPWAKTVFAALATVAGYVVTGLVTGHWDKDALAVAITGLVTTVLVYGAANDPLPVPPPVPPVEPV